MIKNKRALSIIISLCLLLIMAAGGGSVVSADEIHNNSMNLTVGENIVSNYVIDYQSYGAEGGVALRYTYNCVSEQAQYVTKTSDVISFDSLAGEDYYRFSVAQAAAQIAEPTTVEILNTDGETVDTVEYSAKAYCDSVINMTAEERAGYTHKAESLTKLCMSIITYAKSAQEYFPDYMQQQGAVAITDDYSSELDLDNAEYTPLVNKTDGENVSFRSASFICTSGAKLRVYLSVQNEKDDTLYEEPSVSAPQGASWEKGYVVKNGVKSYYIQINDILPDYFDLQTAISYAGAQISVSVLDYAGSVINSTSTSEQAKALAKSLIVYNENARDYFAPISHGTVLVPANAASCTETGNAEYYICEECGKLFSDENAQNEISIESVTIPALGHDYEAAVTAPTCTEQGYTTYTCTRCGDSYTAEETAALGHTPAQAVEENRTEPTCTVDGSYDTVIYCSVCNTEISRETTALPATGHSFGEWTVETAPTLEADGVKRRDCTKCDYYETEAIPALNITVKLPNVDSYLYRAGNGNNIALSSLFKAKDSTKSIDSSKVSLTIQNVAGTAAGTYTANTSSWGSGTVKFTGTGVVKLTIKQDGYTDAELYLEVVSGNNIAEGATLSNITSANAVLLGDVNVKKINITSNKVLYGNGFTVTDIRTDTSGAANAYITMSGGGTIDNAVILGQIYESAVTSGQENQYYAPGIWITGDANIYNSYVSETKNAVQINAGTVYFENSTFAGGAIANIEINGGDVTLKDCVTSTSDRGGIKGLGIRATSANCKIHLLGTFTQYNMLKKSELSSTFSGVLSSVYNDSTYAYTYNSNTYVNMGIFFLAESNNVTTAQAMAVIDDKTNNNYGYVEKTSAGITATSYTLKAAGATPSILTSPAYDETVNGQYPIPATYSFDYTTKNYIAKTDGSNEYCYYDSTTKSVQISFDKESDSSAFSWDTMILSVSKNGNTLGYTVSMNGTDYTNKSISFAESGDYEVVYTYTDPYNYTLGGATFSKTYTKTVNITVTAVEPDTVVYKASFTYDGAAGNYNAKKVIGTDSKTYVMPDVSATSSTIGSTTVAGQTVYYPIVTVNPTSSNGNTAYSSGKGYYFAPVFSELHIIDYNQDTGAQLYEYSKSTKTWPRGKSATSGPDTAYFTCASGEQVWSSTSPYARSMKSQYYKYGSNNLGVCYTSSEIEKDNTACNHLVQYHYVSTDGTTYYYYVYYKFGAMTYSSGGCVAEGTLVTMADGSKKPIEEIKQGDEVLTWSFFNGRYEAQPIALVWNHGKKDWEVLTLHFSDGTDIRTIYDHGYFDTELNDFAYINSGNVDSFVGHSFIKQSGDGGNEEAVLEGYDITYENVGCYSLMSAGNFNFITEDFISLTSEDNHNGAFEFFEIGDGMKYDEVKMANDIAAYGLYTYEDFEQYLSPEQFDALNFKYFKVLVGKGVITYDELVEMIDNYVE